MSCQLTISLGVYVLGAADPGERRRVEEHLPTCAACRAELRRLTPLPGLLARVPADMLAAGQPGAVAAGQPPVPGVGHGTPRARRGRLGGPWRIAAASLAIAASAAGGFWLDPGAAARHPATVTLAGVSPSLHMSATAVLTATSWGTRIELRLHGLPRNVRCRLVVRSRTGATEVAGYWDAWSPGPVSVPASAAWRPSDITSLQVMAAAGTLVQLSAGRGGAGRGDAGTGPAGPRRAR